MDGISSKLLVPFLYVSIIAYIFKMSILKMFIIACLFKNFDGDIVI